MKWPGPVETNISEIGRTIKGLNMESNQFILKIYKCCKTAKHFVATFDWLKIYRSGHGLYLYSSGNRYKGQYVAGRKVNLVYFLRHNCFGIRFAALRMVFRILIQPYSGGFRSVLVDDWDTRRGEVCRPICRWEKVKRRCFCLKRCEQITVLLKNRWKVEHFFRPSPLYCLFEYKN